MWQRSCTVQVSAEMRKTAWAVMSVSALYGASAAAYAGKTSLRMYA